MGYDVHITRQTNWWEKDEDKLISGSDWQKVVNEDSEMRFYGFVEATFPSGGTLRYDDPLVADWTEHPEYEAICFDFRRGNVVVKNPDEVILKKMHCLARRLQAQVQGDDGEFYDEHARPFEA